MIALYATAGRAMAMFGAGAIFGLGVVVRNGAIAYRASRSGRRREVRMLVEARVVKYAGRRK